MRKEFAELAQRAKDEGWDSFRIMAEFMALQKQIDAELADKMGCPEVAEAIRAQ